MNKSHLIDLVAGELKTSKLQAALLVETVLGGIRKGLELDQSVTLTGFGPFPGQRTVNQPRLYQLDTGASAVATNEAA